MLPEWLVQPVTEKVVTLQEAWHLSALIEDKRRPPKHLMTALGKLYLWLMQADKGETVH
jgi:hypothetical protein